MTGARGFGIGETTEMKTTGKILAVAGLGALLLGCATPPHNMEGYRTVDEIDGLPVLKAAAFHDTTPKRAMFADFEIREDYVRYDANGAKAEVFYINPRNGFWRNIALEHRHGSSNIAEVFNFFRGRTVEQADGVFLRTDFGPLWYRILTLPDDNRSCVVFNSERDEHPDDSLLRPDKVLFGYYCPPAGETLDAAAVKRVLDGLGVRGVDLPFPGKEPEIGGLASPAMQRQLEMLVRGGAGAREWGAASFPFPMAAPYTPSDNYHWR